MADTFSRKKRSLIMSKIRGKGTSVEKALEIILGDLGLNPEHHVSSLPGTPDFVLPTQKVAIFANGCFWHGHRGCRRATLPSTNRSFWKKKIATNRRRDQRQNRLLRSKGWKVLTFWTCQRVTHAEVASRLCRAGIRHQRLKTKERA